jgi:ATP adenylyltransferase
MATLYVSNIMITFEQLRDFLQNRMSMSHTYQPVMIRELLVKGGRASVRDCASAFLARDESQIEYYEQITKRMPGKVLAKHGVVERDGDGFRLALDASTLSADERDELVRVCDDATDAYVQRRGDAYDHRRSALGYVSGSTRYQVLKAANGRCELCGVSARERALEVDHIKPRSRGGSDDISNFQALCWKCNAGKGASDDTDFRCLEAV